ncbi:hypothetical protein F4820DRAFT_405118 [Hypoxylon rubiginosum]|uniref:Uncharacterized protein n=1 Tax=Hypoxylon rubiginosum TaxID=110542 RepID=A0ACB9ZEP4_9PEZI|nr:hypothetical protein F4820DRAFT_405118 [Hypoxylon rubiginosum]
MCTADLFLGLLAILFPPLPVWVKCGLCSADSIINILLCMLGYIPGLLHAWYIISKFPETYEYEAVPPDDERGHVYVFVQQPEREPQPQPKPSNAPPSHPNYGGTSNGNSNNHAASSSSAGPANGHDEGGAAAPPTYAEAVKGDNKIQTHD